MLTKKVNEIKDMKEFLLKYSKIDKVVFEKNNLKTKDAKIIQELLEKGYKITVITDEKSVEFLYEYLRRRLMIEQLLQENIEIIF